MKTPTPKSWRIGWYCSCSVRLKADATYIYMSTNPRLVSVKLTPVGRPHTFLSTTRPESAPRPGEQVVVQSDGGPAVGVVVRGVPQTAERKLPAGEAPHRVIRIATH